MVTPSGGSVAAIHQVYNQGRGRLRLGSAADLGLPPPATANIAFFVTHWLYVTSETAISHASRISGVSKKISTSCVGSGDRPAMKRMSAPYHYRKYTDV